MFVAWEKAYMSRAHASVAQCSGTEALCIHQLLMRIDYFVRSHSIHIDTPAFVQP